MFRLSFEKHGVTFSSTWIPTAPAVVDVLSGLWSETTVIDRIALEHWSGVSPDRDRSGYTAERPQVLASFNRVGSASWSALAAPELRRAITAALEA